VTDTPDPRLHPYRADLAAAKLKGLVQAPRFAEPKRFQLIQGVAAMRKAPQERAEQTNELRFGDEMDVYDITGGYAWGQSARDDYVGYVKADALSDKIFKPTHRITNPLTFVFAEPSVKAPVLQRLTFYSSVVVTGEKKDFFEISAGGFIHAKHAALADKVGEADYVFNAGRFLGVPYLWGGVTPLGCDCSGLVQTALLASGRACPRDSDMQAKTLGRELGSRVDEVDVRRGDLVFFKGHVGLMADRATLLHANAFHGKVVAEPLADVIGRGDAVTSIRRL
jgi:cell wall-associated NlpC family hydrolase